MTDYKRHDFEFNCLGVANEITKTTKRFLNESNGKIFYLNILHIET